MNSKVLWLIGALQISVVFDHDRREGGCGSSTNPKDNCVSRELVASGAPTRSLSSWQYPKRLAKPRRSEAQEREDYSAAIQNTSSDRAAQPRHSG